MIREIDDRIGRALGKIRLAFRGVITLVKAAGNVQLLQVDGLAGEQLQDNELFQHYGFTSNPPPGTMAIILPIGGKTAHGVIIATEHGSYRVDLRSGESAIYDNQGQKVHLTRDGIVIDGAGKPVTVQNTPSVDFITPQVNLSGDLTVEGMITGQAGMSITGSFSNNDTDVGSEHKHGGVEPGGGICGVPV